MAKLIRIVCVECSVEIHFRPVATIQTLFQGLQSAHPVPPSLVMSDIITDPSPHFDSPRMKEVVAEQWYTQLAQETCKEVQLAHTPSSSSCE